MTDYPNLARQITDLRKRGDIEGAIAAFKQSPEEDRRQIAVRSAMAWCLYDRDIKPCNDPKIQVTSAMIVVAEEALKKIRIWCDHDLTGQFSAFPTAYLLIAKILKEHEMTEELLTLLSDPHALNFSWMSNSIYPSHLDRWSKFALDHVKTILANENLTKQNIAPAKALLDNLGAVEKSLSRIKPKIVVDGRPRSLPSPQQRFVMQLTKFLQVNEDWDNLATACESAQQRQIFDKDPNLKWILYRHALALSHSDPTKALTVCNEFIKLECKPYSLLLRAEILLKLERRDEALREVAHSLQIISNKDLPYITKNLAMIAELTDDIEVRKIHIQMLRSIRIEQGHKPSAELETAASELGLPSPDEDFDASLLRQAWDKINPRGVKNEHRHVPEPRPDVLTSIDQLGDIVLASLTTKNGENKVRPVVIIGQAEKQIIVSPISNSVGAANSVSLDSWEQAGLKFPCVMHRSRISLDATAIFRKIGRLSDQDIDRIKELAK
jgi:hypothetical protein